MKNTTKRIAGLTLAAAATVTALAGVAAPQAHAGAGSNPYAYDAQRFRMPDSPQQADDSTLWVYWADSPPRSGLVVGETKARGGGHGVKGVRFSAGYDACVMVYEADGIHGIKTRFNAAPSTTGQEYRQIATHDGAASAKITVVPDGDYTYCEASNGLVTTAPAN